MEEFDRSYLHPLLEHSKQTFPCRETPTSCTACRHSIAKSYSNSLRCFVIRNLYMDAMVHVAITHALLLGGASSNVALASSCP
jgi:hypothetical protein